RAGGRLSPARTRKSPLARLRSPLARSGRYHCCNPGSTDPGGADRRKSSSRPRAVAATGPASRASARSVAGIKAAPSVVLWATLEIGAEGVQIAERGADAGWAAAHPASADIGAKIVQCGTYRYCAIGAEIFLGRAAAAAPEVAAAQRAELEGWAVGEGLAAAAAAPRGSPVPSRARPAPTRRSAV